MADDAVAAAGDITNVDSGAAGAADASAAAAVAVADAGKAAVGDAVVADASKAGPAEAAKQADAGNAADPAPVDYGKTIGEVKLPDGITLDPASAKAAGELFGKHKVSAELAKELTSFYANQVKAGQELSAKAFSDQVGRWKAAAESDADIGGKEGMAEAKAAVAKFFDTDTAKVLEQFGLTNHPGFIKSARKIGQAIKDDTYVPGGAAVNGARDARSRFPNSNMNP